MWQDFLQLRKKAQFHSKTCESMESPSLDLYQRKLCWIGKSTWNKLWKKNMIMFPYKQIRNISLGNEKCNEFISVRSTVKQYCISIKSFKDICLYWHSLLRWNWTSSWVVQMLLKRTSSEALVQLQSYRYLEKPPQRHTQYRCMLDRW